MRTQHVVSRAYVSKSCGAEGSTATGAKVTEESQSVQEEFPSANADWESSDEGETNPEKFPSVGEEPSSEEKGTEAEENSSTMGDSCKIGDSCKVY